MAKYIQDYHPSMLIMRRHHQQRKETLRNPLKVALVSKAMNVLFTSSMLQLKKGNRGRDLIFRTKRKNETCNLLAVSMLCSRTCANTLADRFQLACFFILSHCLLQRPLCCLLNILNVGHILLYLSLQLSCVF